MSKENIFMREVDKPSALQFSIRLIPKLISLLLRSILFLPLWPLFWLGWLIWYRPPNVPYVKQVLRYLRHAWTVSPENPKMYFIGRLWLFLSFLQIYLNSPLVGVAWLLDELLYGRALNAMSVKEPFFVISAGRSGSTQITRYLNRTKDWLRPIFCRLCSPISGYGSWHQRHSVDS